MKLSPKSKVPDLLKYHRNQLTSLHLMKIESLRLKTTECQILFPDSKLYTILDLKHKSNMKPFKNINLF